VLSPTFGLAKPLGETTSISVLLKQQ